MKKIILILTLLLCTLTYSKNEEKKKLYVGTNGEYKPYEYYENQKLVGFDIEFMEMIAEKLNVEIVWKDMSFDGLLSALQTKKIDAVIAGMVGNEDRKKVVNFTIPYLKQAKTSGEVVIVAENSQLKTEEDLKGKTLGVQLGTVQEAIAKELGGETRNYSSNVAALMAVQQGKLDGVVLSYKPAEGYLETMKGLKLLVNLGQKQPSQAAIAFHKSNPEIVEKVNAIILELQQTEEYNELFKKYFD